ncbi:hypothetical protein Bca101_060501 [Brassica carinata]
MKSISEDTMTDWHELIGIITGEGISEASIPGEPHQDSVDTYDEAHGNSNGARVSCSTIFVNKELEVELETTRESCKQGMEQTVVKEKKRFNQIQCDMEELRKQYMEMESLLNSMKVCIQRLMLIYVRLTGRESTH